MLDRILVYGVTGSGKSALAARISEQIGAPWHPVDDLTWQPGWAEVGPDEQRRRITEICAGDRWILDAAYGKWLDVVLEPVQLIVALDYPRWLSLGRLLRRTMLRVVGRQRICNGNVETLRRALSSDSIIRWHFRSFARKRERIRAWADDPSGPSVIRLTSSRAARRWMATLPAR